MPACRVGGLSDNPQEQEGFREMADDMTAVLLDIAMRLGNLEGQNALITAELKQASEGRRRMYQMHEENQAALAITMNNLGHVVGDVKEMKVETDKIPSIATDVKTVAEEVEKIKPTVETLKGFRVQMALAATAVGAVVSGAITLIWLALTHIGEIKAAFRNLMRF